MKIKLIIGIALGLLLLTIAVPVLASDDIVATATKMSATSNSYQRSCFYTEGRHWVFYVDDSSYRYVSSVDAFSWSGPVTVLNNKECEEGCHVSLYFDGEYVHYAHAFFSPTHTINYRKGKPEADGTITWLAPSSKPREATILPRLGTRIFL